MTTLIHHSYFTRSQYDMNKWFYPLKYGTNTTTLDLFDSFDELDTTIGKNYFWITKPEFLQQQQQYQGARIPQKYRIMIDCTGYGPKSVKTEFVGRKLYVIGHEEHRVSNDDFYNKEFKKPFDLPASAEIDKFSSFMTTSGHFVIEFPLKETSAQSNSELIPKMFDMNGGVKGIQMKFALPDNYDQTKVMCYIKDRDFIVQTEDKSQKYDAYVKYFYYKRSILPEMTDFDQLKSYFENNKIVVTAPFRTDYKGQFRTGPMECCTKKH